MTLVASFSVNKYPVLIGDLMTSGIEDPEKPAYIPTVGNITKVFPEGSYFVPTGVRQKTCIIDGDIAIGWAGDAYAARTAISSIQEENRRKKLVPTSLIWLLDRLMKEKGSADLSLMGYINDGDIVRSFRRGGEDFRSKYIGTVGLIGASRDSGKPLLKEIDIPHPANRVIKAQVTPFYVGIAYSGQLMAHDIATHGYSALYFGGGYEIIGSERSRFIKFDLPIYFFWIAKVLNGVFSIDPMLIYKYEYRGDVLHIRTAMSKGKSEEKGRYTFDLAQYCAGPILREITEEDANPIPSLSWDTNLICNFFFVHDNEGKSKATLMVLHWSGQKSPPMKVIELDGDVEIDINPEFMDEIMKNGYQQLLRKVDFSE